MLLGPVYNLHEAVTTTPTDSKLMEGASQHIGYFNILKLLRDAKQHNIQLGSSLININCRVTIIHGEKVSMKYIQEGLVCMALWFPTLCNKEKSPAGGKEHFFIIECI